MLVDNGQPLTQSLAILLYLEAKYPDHPLLPTDILERHRTIAMVAEMDDKLYGDVEHEVFAKGLKKDATDEVLKEINEKADKELAVWESYLTKAGTGFLLGDKMTIADAAMVPFMS